MSLKLIHHNIGNAGVLFLAIAGIWALAIYFRRREIDGNLWGILAIGELLFVAQAIMGVVMYAGGGRPDRLIHYLYGILMMILIPATFAFTGGKTSRNEALVYGLMAMFMAVMAATRAMTAG